MKAPRVGLMVGYPGDGDALERMVERSQWAEQQGFHFVVLGERILWRQPHLDTFIAASAVFSHTQVLKMVCLLLVPVRHPVITSKIITSLDQLSRGRLIISPCIGGDYPHEYRNLGVPMQERVGRTEEGLRIMRRLWSEPKVSYNGSYYRLDDVTAQPAPFRPGGPPLWLAHRGRAKASIKRAVELCDGWLAAWISPERFKRVQQMTVEYAHSISRDPATLTPAAIVRMVVANSQEAAAQKAAKWRSMMYGHAQEPTLMQHLLPLGTPDDCAAHLKAFVDAGVTDLAISAAAPEEDWEEQLHLFVTEVLPRAGIPLGLKERV